MINPGDPIESPVTGEKMTFLVTGNESTGQLLRIDMSVRPGGFVAAEHVHPLQQERFLIKAGQITLRIRENEQHYKTGDEVAFPLGSSLRLQFCSVARFRECGA